MISDSGFAMELEKAVHKREIFLDEQKFSASQDTGQLAILISRCINPYYFDDGKKQPDVNKHTVELKIATQYRSFLEEAERLQRSRKDQYNDIEIGFASAENITGCLRDRDVSGIVFIGHGNVNEIWLDREQIDLTEDIDKTIMTYDWLDVSKNTNHLKQGYIEQRMCSRFNRSQGNVPLGTFALSSLNRLLVSSNRHVPDNDPGDALFVPVFNEIDDIRHQIYVVDSRYSKNEAK